MQFAAAVEDILNQVCLVQISFVLNVQLVRGPLLAQQLVVSVNQVPTQLHLGPLLVQLVLSARMVAHQVCKYLLALAPALLAHTLSLDLHHALH
jgi:hypothetical protein